MDSDHLCRECDGTGWVLYRLETKDGEFEEAYRLCPKGHAPRYCMGSSCGHLCPRLASVRCGLGYYCKEHIVASMGVGILTTLASLSRGPAAPKTFDVQLLRSRGRRSGVAVGRVGR